jgi:hypothetical protein
VVSDEKNNGLHLVQYDTTAASQQVPQQEQELLTVNEHLSSLQVLVGTLLIEYKLYRNYQLIAIYTDVGAVQISKMADTVVTS